MRKPCSRRIALALLVVSAVIMPLTQTDPPKASANNLPPLGVIIRGHGNGHGRGLSQYGAFAWATRLGSTWQAIIDFYYGGSGRTLTSLTPADAGLTPGGVMSVRLEVQDGKQAAVVSDSKTLTWTGKSGTYGSMIARPVSTNTYDIYASPNIACGASTGTPAGFTLIGDNVRGPIDFVTTNSSNPAAIAPTDLVGLCEPATSAYRARIRYYRGGIRATVDGVNNHRVVNLVALESYLRGVVPRESPAGWGDAAGGLGMHALRAQAVAARSYSLSEARYSYAKTCDTQNCQVYGGAALRTVGSSAAVIEDSRTDRAIAETAGFVVKDSRNSIVRTEFTSSNGGRTASGTFQAKIDNGDITADAALQNWTRFISAAQLQKMYPASACFSV